MDTDQQQAITDIRTALAEVDVPWSETAPGLFSVSLPGTKKLVTECALEVGRYTVQIRAFVARHPDENAEGVYRWLLERNLKLSGVAFSVDALGDIYLTGRLPLDQLSTAGVDRILGTVAD